MFRVEVVYHNIKTFLQVSSSDLLSVLKKLTHALDHQIITDGTRRSEEKSCYLNGLPSMFTPYAGDISF